MAKDKETKKPINLMDVNEDNFEENIDNAGKFSEDVIKLATEKAEKDQAERKAREYNDIKDKAAYQKLRLVADCVYAKKTMEAQKKAMKAVDDLFEQVKEGKIDSIDFDKAREKAIDDAIKEVEAIGKKRRENLEKLRNQFPAHYCYVWDNPFSRLNRAIENNKN